MKIHPDLQSRSIPKASKVILIAAALFYVVIACYFWIVALIIALIFLQTFAYLVLQDLSALAWKCRLSKVYATGCSKKMQVLFSVVSQDSYGDPLYLVHPNQPLRSFPSVLRQAAITTLQGRDQAVYFSLRTFPDLRDLIGYREATVFLDPINGEVMCIEIDELRLWRSRFQFKKRNAILWEILSSEEIPVGAAVDSLLAPPG